MTDMTMFLLDGTGMTSQRERVPFPQAMTDHPRRVRRKREVRYLISALVLSQVSTSLAWSRHPPLFRSPRYLSGLSPRTSRQGSRLWEGHGHAPSPDGDISSRLLPKANGEVVKPAEGVSIDTELAILKEENNILRETVRQLEQENERLHKNAGMIVIENFEGERSTPSKWFGAMQGDDVEMQGITMTGEQIEGYPLWCDELEEDTCPIEPTISFGEALRDRAYWLVGLLALQSCSGFILSRNEILLARHPVIIYFLTMLVGAGGNAGNQASVRGTCVSYAAALLSMLRGLLSLTAGMCVFSSCSDPWVGSRNAE